MDTHPLPPSSDAPLLTQRQHFKKSVIHFDDTVQSSVQGSTPDARPVSEDFYAQTPTGTDTKDKTCTMPTGNTVGSPSALVFSHTLQPVSWHCRQSAITNCVCGCDWLKFITVLVGQPSPSFPLHWHNADFMFASVPEMQSWMANRSCSTRGKLSENDIPWQKMITLRVKELAVARQLTSHTSSHHRIFFYYITGSFFIINLFYFIMSQKHSKCCEEDEINVPLTLSVFRDKRFVTGHEKLKMFITSLAH